MLLDWFFQNIGLDKSEILDFAFKVAEGEL
jgi:hypothetical protein